MQTRRALLGELLPLLELDAATLAPQQFDGIGPGSQILSVIVRDESLDVTGRIEFALDDAWLARLFATCVPRRVRDTVPSGDDGSLGARIPVALHATIMSRELLLGDVLDLNRGSILPIRLPDAADVDVDGLKVFRAAVVEHGGKICLTAFELVE
nr:FliM/FliN family flagellar motor C-terminal domain-containing protein [Burkholderia dolosa]